ncbi:MAG: ERCC4 domain-containing protein [Agriterribacter sp.]
MPVSIHADHREIPSGIPHILSEIEDISLSVLHLPAGDYIINTTIGVERKSAEDFVQSIICNRLFDQVARLKKSVSRTLLIVEGNPYHTDHKIQCSAIRGAVLSVLIAWQVPVIFSKNREDTVALLLAIVRQDKTTLPQLKAPKNYRSKKLASRQLFFLQGIPGIGPALAARMLEKFGSLKAAVNATEKELQNVEGIGKGNAKKIFDFINAI